MNQIKLDCCPNCEMAMKTEGLKVTIMYHVYKCISCRNVFCEFCGDTFFRDDEKLICPHCKIECFDAEKISRKFIKSIDAVEITPFATFCM